MLQPESFSFKLTKAWAYWFVIFGLVVSTGLGYVGQLKTGLPAYWNNFFLDSFIKNTVSERVTSASVVVDIDDVSLSAVGQWPWPRYRIASLVQAIADSQPAAIGVDVVFPEPDRTSIDNIKKTFKQDFDLDISIDGVSQGLSDNDGYFGHILSKTGAVGARYFYFDHVNHEPVDIKPEFHFTGKTSLLVLNDAPGVLSNTDKISSQLAYNGHVNQQPDNDGLLRKIPFLIKHNGYIYPHLSLATYMRSLEVDSVVIDEDGHGLIMRVGRHDIPIDKHGFALLRLNGGAHLYPSVSAVDVLNGSFDKNLIEKRTVFIGSSAAGLNDFHSTIFDSQFPGLKIQAAVIDNIVNNGFVREPSWAGIATVLVSVFVGMLVTLLFIYFREPLKLFFGALTLATFILLASLSLFIGAEMFLSPGTSLVVILLLYTVFSTTGFLMEKKQAYVWYRKLSYARQVTIESMVAVAETRDPETGAHIKRTQHYVKAIAEKLKSEGYYANLLTQDYINLLFVSAPLHDIGKVGVPDHILLKPGKLTAKEFEIMKKHAEYGKEIINSTTNSAKGDDFLTVASEIAATHHEKWDGTGYPLGLAGQDIPLSGRLMAVADVYDALISKRCYKEAFSHEKSIEMMRKESGKIFEPEMLDVFFSIEEQILEIASTFQD